MCLEEGDLGPQWINIQKQNLHIPCLVEIIKRNKIPKNPLTNLPLCEEDLQKIEEQAQELKIFCLRSIYRKYWLQCDATLTELQQLTSILNVPGLTDIIERKKQEVERLIHQTAKHFQYCTFFQDVFLDFKTLLDDRLKKFEEKCFFKISSHLEVTDMRQLEYIFIPRFQSFSYFS